MSGRIIYGRKYIAMYTFIGIKVIEIFRAKQGLVVCETACHCVNHFPIHHFQFSMFWKTHFLSQQIFTNSVFTKLHFLGGKFFPRNCIAEQCRNCQEIGLPMSKKKLSYQLFSQLRNSPPRNIAQSRNCQEIRLTMQEKLSFPKNCISKGKK